MKNHLLYVLDSSVQAKQVVLEKAAIPVYGPKILLVVVTFPDAG
jgi:hypothetical protein